MGARLHEQVRLSRTDPLVVSEQTPLDVAQEKLRKLSFLLAACLPDV